MREMLANDAMAKAGTRFWQHGLVSGLLVMRNPKLVEGYFTLLTLSIDRCIAVSGKADSLATNIANLANTIDNANHPPRPDLSRMRKSCVSSM